MFKKMKDFLAENHKGKKFMEVESTKRSTTEFRKMSREMVDWIAEQTGAKTVVINLQTEESMFTGWTAGSTAEDAIRLYEVVLERIIEGIPLKVAQVVIDANKAGNGGPSIDDIKTAAAMAMDEVLNHLPVEDRKKAIRKMKTIMEEREGKKSKGTSLKESSSSEDSEEDMLDDLLK